MAMSSETKTYNEDIMSQFEDTYLELIDAGSFGLNLVSGMKREHGTQALPYLVMMCGDGDFVMSTLFSQFQLRSLVRATYNAKSCNYAVCTEFLDKLRDRAFWALSRKQMLKLSMELRSLFPDTFTFLKSWEVQFRNIGVDV